MFEETGSVFNNKPVPQIFLKKLLPYIATRLLSIRVFPIPSVRPVLYVEFWSRRMHLRQ